MTSPAGLIEFVLNGRPVRIGGDAADGNLLDFIRARGLTGAKEGCAEGECGACAVALVTAEGRRSAYRAVNSCLLPLAAAAGQEIVTVEGLAIDGRLAPAQAALAAAGGSQCGYCTPGFVISLFAEQYRPHRAGPCDVAALAGNLCRCTGYRPIRDAALALGAPPAGPHLARLASPAPMLDAVDTAGFVRPRTITACLAALADDRGAALLAGGTDLGVDANLRGRRPARFVALEAVDELRSFTTPGSTVHIGAALPLSDLPRMWPSAPPVIHEWLELFASPLIRNRATLGGNLATASPIGDAAPLLLACDAVIHSVSRAGTRQTPIASFFTGYRTTVLADDAIITAIELPLPLPASLRFYKVAKRRLDDISTVAAALAVERDAGGVVTRARLAFGGVAATPIRAFAAEAALVGQRWTPAAVARAQEVLAARLRPMSDQRGSHEYRLAVAQRLLEKHYAEAGG